MIRIAWFFPLIIFASFMGGLVNAETAEQAWSTLVDEKFSQRAEFNFIANNEKLPNVLLYGDSISIHYTEHVRDKLAGKANVYRIYLNGGNSSSFIPKMEKMYATMQDPKLLDAWEFDWDIIHFNVGLHDLKYIKDKKRDKLNGIQVTSIEGYEKNLRAIVSYLKQLSSKAVLIFATTTPIPEGEPGRVVGDAIQYN